MQLALSGAPVSHALEVLVKAAEAQSDRSFLASILLLDGRKLRHGAAPSLPAAYNSAIDGIEIGPRVGSCGTAAHFGHAIFVTDISRDPLWTDFSQLALSHGLRACWSTPFLSRDGKVLGTLALYYREPRGPSEVERELVAVVGATASLVVENATLHAQLMDLNHQARLAADIGGIGFFTWEVATDKVIWHNRHPYAMFGLDPTEPPINASRFASEFLHPEDRDAFSRAVASALDDTSTMRFTCRIHRRPAGEMRWLELHAQVDALARDQGLNRMVGVVRDVTDAKRQHQGDTRGAALATD